jgi:glutamate/tyrosine decarboxylase-like PLP-dependent enzyme
MEDAAIEKMLRDRPQLLRDAAARADTYLATVGDRRVSPAREAIEGLAAFDVALPGRGLAAEEVLAQLDEIGSAATVATTGPRFFGFVNGGALPIAVATAWLVAAWDQNNALRVMSPVSLNWIIDLLGLAKGTGGGFVSGASMANTTCLAAARDATLRAAGWDALGQGLVGAPPIQVVVGAEAHSTVHKALGLVGLGRERVLRLPTDGQGRIRTDDLPSLSSPAIVCLQAGNVNTGASDPFVELIDWAKGLDAWVHVDGAFGLWAAAAPELSSEVEGMHRADSWATDAHKWLNTTYDSGIALVADADALRSAMQATAAYLPHGEGREPMSYTPQTSQRARGVEVWAVLASLGREGIADLVTGSVRHARRFAEALSGAGFEILNQVRLNQVLVDFGGKERNAAVLARIQDDGTCWCGPTQWHGQSAMRISVSCWATGTGDVEASIEAMLHAATTS